VECGDGYVVGSEALECVRLNSNDSNNGNISTNISNINNNNNNITNSTISSPTITLNLQSLTGPYIDGYTLTLDYLKSFHS
jgi:hypothetical protein